MKHEDFMDYVKYKVKEMENNKGNSININDVYVVWSCKTLQNSKCLASSRNLEKTAGYYEFTLNGDKEEIYIDRYVKDSNTCIKTSEIDFDGITQDFAGYIKGVKIFDKSIYYSMDFLMEKLEEKFGAVKPLFVKDLVSAIETLYLKYEDFSFAQLEHDFESCIEEANGFVDLVFKYCDSDWKIEWLNQRINGGYYEKCTC